MSHFCRPWRFLVNIRSLHPMIAVLNSYGGGGGVAIVATGFTEVNTSTPLLPEGVSGIDADPLKKQ